MQNNTEKDDFNFTYSAKEQQELRRIREKYAGGKEEDKMTRLRRLDAGVTQKAQVVALCLGVIGALILGFGMSIIMTELGDYMLSSALAEIIVGVAVGLIGVVLVALAYPMYNVVLKRERKKVTPEILRLTDELLK